MSIVPELEVSKERRMFSLNIVKALCGVAFVALGVDAGVRARTRRRVRRRTRRRIRRRIAWRTVNNVRVVVVPVDIAVQDEFIMEDGGVATITRIGKKDITIIVNKAEQTIPAVYEGSVDDGEGM